MKVKILTKDIVEAYNRINLKKPYLILNGEKLGVRTSQQNRALYLYFTQLAEMFNSAGLDMRVVLKPDVDIEWTIETIKKYIWSSFQKLVLGTDKTRDLKKGGDIERVHDHINRYLANGEKTKHLPYLPFPSLETQLENQQSEPIDYPDDYNDPNLCQF